MKSDDIKDRKSFEAWLNARPEATRRQEAIALAHRAAMRAMPLLQHRAQLTAGWAVRLIFTSIRCNAISRIAGKSATREIQKSAASIAFSAEADATATNSDGGAIAAAAAYAAAYAAFSTFSNPVSDAATAAYYATARNDSADFYPSSGKQLRFEAGRLEAGMLAAELTASPLWEKEPEFWHKVYLLFGRLLDEDEFAAQGFGVWRQWYDAARTGNPAFGIRNADLRQTLERNIALGSTDGKFDKAFWDHEPAEINADIKRWVEEAQAEDERLAHEVIKDLPPESAMRQPHENVTQFSQGPSGEIIALADPLSPAAGRDEEELEELYDEARSKAFDLAALGKNMLGSCSTPVDDLLNFLPDDFELARINRIHSRLSTLRDRDYLHGLQMAKPVEERDNTLVLHEEVAVKLSACVAQFNILIAFDKRGRELNQLAYGPDARNRADAVNEAMRPIINNIHVVGDSNTVAIVQGDHSAIVNAPRDIHGDQAVQRVAQQDENLAMSILQAGWSIAKAVHEKQLSEPSLQFIAAQFGAYGPKILNFIKDFDESFLWLAQHVEAFTILSPLILLLVAYSKDINGKKK